MVTDLKAYIIATETNLAIIKDKLLEKYKTLSITGTNSMEEGIRTALNKHVLAEYDVLIIVPQTFVALDTQSKHELSNLINTAGNYSARDLPIYFCCKKDNSDYHLNLKKLLTNQNVRVYPYNELSVADFEQIIKEVATYRGKNKSNIDQDTEQDILGQKIKAYQGGRNGYLDRIFDVREESGEENLSRMRRVKDLIAQTSKVNMTNSSKTFKDSTQTLEEIKTNLFNRTEKTPDSNTIVNAQEVNGAFIQEQLKVDNASDKLREISIEYDDYMNYMADIEDVIEQVRASGTGEKSNLVLELMQERSLTHKNAHSILVDFITKIAETSIDHITETITQDLNRFSEINEVDELVGGKLKEIEIMKNNRDSFKNELKSITEKMHQLTAIVRESLTDMGNSYRITAEQMQNDMIEYANENGLMVQNNSMTPVDRKLMVKLQDSFNSVSRNVNSLINVSNTTVKNFMELVMKDEEIIEKQDETINMLMTQKTKKIIVLDNNIQVNSYGVWGIDGAGKTHTAYALATALSKQRKVMLVDLNYKNPSLKFYNKTQDVGGGQWLNNKTIVLENFINLPNSNKLGKMVPFEDNLTIVQPSKSFFLTELATSFTSELFVEQFISLLKQLTGFYDNFVFILPQDTSEIPEIFKHIGKMLLVTDTNPSNFLSTGELSKQSETELEKVPIKYIVVNKIGKGIQLTADFISTNLNVSLTEYALLKIPTFNESPLMKIEGKNPYRESLVVERYFNEIIKNI